MSNKNLDEFVAKIINLANDQKLSDCSFLVGTDPKRLFYGHKIFLAMSSDVFASMFFGDLKETEMPIPVPDITAAGFRNLLNYLYSHKIEVPPSELYETFVAADKYLVTSFVDQFSEYVKSILNISNCCMVYNQIIKIEKNEDILDHVRKMIISNSRAVFNNENFENINEDALNDILNMDSLNLGEIDILKGCSKWVNNQVKKRKLESTADNKREIFKSIRHLIDFLKIEEKDLKSFEEIDNLFSVQEIGQLYRLKLFPHKYSSLKCNTLRTKLTSFTVINGDEWDFTFIENVSGSINAALYVLLTSNREISISNILTRFSKHRITDLYIEIRHNRHVLDIKVDKKLIEDIWAFEFIEVLKIKPNTLYVLKFGFKSKFCPSIKSSQTRSIIETEDSENKIRIELTYLRIHPIKEINFYS